MQKIFIRQIPENLDQSVTLRGWVYNVRSSGKIAFLQFRDGTGIAQAVVVKSDVEGQVWEDAKSLTIESSVEITGQVKEEPRAAGGMEMQVKGLKVVQLAEEYPISKKEHGVDFLMDNRHLWLRSARQRAIGRVRNTVVTQIASYLQSEGFVGFDTPILTPTSCEDTTELFEMDYFPKEGEESKAYLSQSGQLYLEAGIFAHGRAYDFGPVFRAEKSKTRRHLTEFWMMDAEAAFVEHEENMQIQEGLVQGIVEKVLEQNQEELKVLERDLEPLKKIKAPFLRKTHAEVVRELQEMGSDIEPGADLGADDETMLMKKYDQPVFVQKYPAEVKPFYMKRAEGGKLALCNDLLAPEGYGEIIGGSQREDDYQTLKKSLEEHKLSEEDFGWYLDLRKYGSVPHSGFGLGIERTVAWVCGLKHVREAIPFPRTMARLRP